MSSLDSLCGRLLAGDHCMHFSFFQQFRRHTLIQRVLQQPLYLVLDILILAFLKKRECIPVDNRLDFQLAPCAELDILGIAQNKTLVKHVLLESGVQQVRKLLYRKIHWNEPALMHTVYVQREDFLPVLRELKYLDEQLADI